MRHAARIASAVAASAAVAAGFLVAAGTPSGASPPAFAGGGPAHAVFVQTDNPAGNQVVAYDRGPTGQLTPTGTFTTGGLGGQLGGSVVDHLASEGSLTYDRAHDVLYAVNAGSNTVSVFAVHGTQLSLVQVVSSGGSFPVSVTYSGSTVYVLNAGGGGSLQGYVMFFDHLVAIPGSTRPLGLDPTATPPFVNTPGQVGFTPNGSQLVVTTKANTNAIDVFGVGPFGQLSSSPVVNVEPGTVPFGFTFDLAGNLVVTEAGTNALATFRLHRGGTVTEISTVPDGQAAACWVASARGDFYVSNAGSGTVTTYQEAPFGQLTDAGTTPTDPGTVDATATPDGQFLYVQTGGNGVVDAYRVGWNGSLAPVGSVVVPGAVGGEGIVAT